MLELLQELFGAVCGQNPDRSWAPGGSLLLICQRCTGLYPGALFAAVLHLWLRPPLKARLLELHGGFLVLMAPLGFHWIEHGPITRTISGLLFGFGLVTFMLLPVFGRNSRPPLGAGSTKIYLLCLAALACFLPLTALYGGVIGGFALDLLGFGGLVVLLLLAAWNTKVIVGSVRSWLVKAQAG